MTIPPCKGCEERHMACHSECSKYTEWLAIHEQEKGIADNNKLNESKANTDRIESIRRMRQRRRARRDR